MRRQWGWGEGEGEGEGGREGEGEGEENVREKWYLRVNISIEIPNFNGTY